MQETNNLRITFSKIMSSIFPLVLVLSLVLFGSVLGPCEAGVPGYKQPANCARLECPGYEVVHSQQDFEIRHYKATGWIDFPVPDGRSYLDASNRGFPRLFAIHGENKGQVKINMTAPVLVDIPMFPDSIGPVEANASTFAVFFYLPQKFQKDPPMPTDKLSRRVDLPPLQFAAVKRFGGFMTDKTVAKQALDLKESLKGTSWEAALSGTSFTVAGYNGPSEIVNRANEVLFWFNSINS